ncbi:PucR family transcriptional regulator [Yinghuangia seranimata]|uniref:PucR family transcriptional regulator n=1 Tax=Yinghuangia seranimata TaxID=408067 RepID=UPI00248C80E2|nr:PucR family transcriptional regulator [Yinghuangia seranimata]MDI2124730.1 PucR family transcriptional regulator ligand-binding domain-containing protein [Yinghuangia seranimata]
MDDTDRIRPSSTGTLVRGLPVSEVLSVSSLAGARLLAGAAGLDRMVQRLNVMEVPDILPWTKPHELLLTTGYPLRETPQSPADLVVELHAKRLAAIAIKFGRYVDELPAEMLAAADRVGLPIIRLPDDVAFDDILNQVLTDILNRQAAVLARSEEAHRALVSVVLAGGGLGELTEELSGLLGGTVLVTTPDGRILAGSRSPGEEPDARGCFDASGRFRVEEFRHGTRVLEERGARTALVPILAGSLDHGRVVLLAGGDRRLDESDIHVLERAAATAALVITKELAVSAVESKYQGDFLRDLLAGRAGDPGHTVPHCASLGWDIDRPLFVVVAQLEAGEVPDPEPRDLRPTHERFATAWSMVVRERDPKAAVVGYSQEVVVVMGTPTRSSAGEAVRQMVAQVSGDGGGGRRAFSTGVSRVVNSPELLPEAYEQARRAARVGRQMHGPGSVSDFDSLGVYRLLSLVPDSAELTSFMRETLRELATRDDEETEDLRTTLQVLLDTNLNVAETARILHFHYNTLRYRIGKLERMVGPFTTDAHLRLSLGLALQVMRMRGL